MNSTNQATVRAPQFSFGELVRLGRLKFIPYSLVLHLFGVAYVVLEGLPIKWSIVILAQVVVWTLHLLANYSNEYFDQEVDRLNDTPTAWTGGSRVLTEGRLKPSAAKYTFLTLLALGFVEIAILSTFLDSFRAAFPLSVIGLLLAWQYSCPPVQFSYRGLGEADVATFFCALPIYGVVTQSGVVTPELLSIAAVLWITIHARMMVMNMPDRVGDALGGKRTLVVRIGIENAVRLYIFMQFFAYGPLLYFLRGNIRTSFIVALLVVAPIGWWLAWRLWRGDWKEPSKLADIPKFATFHVAGTAGALLLAALFEIVN